MIRLTAKSLTAWRVAKAEEQGGLCALCAGKFTAKNPAVADHDHITGQLRGALHRGCNSMLGVIENGRARYLLKEAAPFHTMLRNLIPYIYERRPDAPYYPTHRDEDQKRELRNKRARASRAKRKAA